MTDLLLLIAFIGIVFLSVKVILLSKENKGLKEIIKNEL